MAKDGAGPDGMGENGASSAREYTPVLGLSDSPGERPQLPIRYGTIYDQPEPDELIDLRSSFLHGMRPIAWQAACNRW